jgi:hypothetical protein
VLNSSCQGNTPLKLIFLFDIVRLSLTAAQVAAARKAIIIDIHKEPWDIDPIKEEELLKNAVLNYEIYPEYLIVVGGIRSVPFVDTGIVQDYGLILTMSFDIYRDYEIQLDDDEFTEISTGRIIGSDVYDASTVVARTLAYNDLAANSDWVSKALLVANPPSGPQSPTTGDIKAYMEDARLSVELEDWEKANCPEVMMEMNNGKNIVFFLHHSSVYTWGFNEWATLEPDLDSADIKMLRLAPQTTQAYTCLAGRLKGGWYSIYSDELLYEPLDLDRSIALAFLEAGSANYISSDSLTYVFVTEDFSKDFYQSLIYDNMTVGDALTHAKNLYLLKRTYAEEMLEEYPLWLEEITGMINDTSKQFILLGDPMFKPLLPKIPEKPIEEEILSWGSENNTTYAVTMTITPRTESATKWTYWFEQPVVGGEVYVRALPSLVGELEIPLEAEDIVVRGVNGVVWHGEDRNCIQNKTIVQFPVIDPMPKLNEARKFVITYQLVPTICWEMNVPEGWSVFSTPLALYEDDIAVVLDNIPYSAIFYLDSTSNNWLYYLKDNPEASTLKKIVPGKAYLIHMNMQAELNLSGRTVESPFELELTKGWNMVGIPSTEAVKIASLTVIAGGEEYTFDTAVQKGIVSAFFFIYKGCAWSYLDSTETLTPGAGYYFEVFDDCRIVVPEIYTDTFKNTDRK